MFDSSVSASGTLVPQPLPSLPRASTQAQGIQSALSTSSWYGREPITRQYQAQREGERTPKEPGLSGPPTLGQGGLLGWGKVASELDLENEVYGFLAENKKHSVCTKERRGHTTVQEEKGAPHTWRGH